MKDLIKKYLQEQVIDKIGETRPYIDPDFIDVYADDIEKLVKNNAVLPLVSISLQRRELAKDVLLALLQNSERYKYIAEQVESGKLKQEEANLKNINKAYKIADSFLSVGANEC